jgi:hypothetical protein
MMFPELVFARVMFGYAVARARTVKERTGNQLGASAIEWAVITAIVVTAALAIGISVKKVIDKRKTEIEQG